MSLDKAIAHGKEHRKPYYPSGRFDFTCRPHGGCPWCDGNRLAKSRAAEKAAREEMMNIEKATFLEAIEEMLAHPGYNHFELSSVIRQTFSETDWDELMKIMKMAGSMRKEK